MEKVCGVCGRRGAGRLSGRIFREGMSGNLPAAVRVSPAGAGKSPQKWTGEKGPEWHKCHSGPFFRKKRQDSRMQSLSKRRSDGRLDLPERVDPEVVRILFGGLPDRSPRLLPAAQPEQRVAAQDQPAHEVLLFRCRTQTASGRESRPRNSCAGPCFGSSRPRSRASPPETCCACVNRISRCSASARRGRAPRRRPCRRRPPQRRPWPRRRRPPPRAAGPDSNRVCAS